ncbi:protein BTG3 [Nerophis lumbriciformis]|uniref:protein BTG3 n=1 Tax=Nerophis lumbriciformis TaxID=546530 RepID=UPI002AE00F19|nr:protein BTG3-like [Nerophis lumbriciformis]XP_061815360.1 protein BTG3-like [Nerophis lumbriciformis]
MERELAVVCVLMDMLVTKLTKQKTELFIEKLHGALEEKFQGHWYPDNPSKGQAYRCIRVNMSKCQDPELLRACRESGVNFSDLGLPPALTLWVDPGEVSCRIGEDSACLTVARFVNPSNKSKAEEGRAQVTQTDESVCSCSNWESSLGDENMDTSWSCRLPVSCGTSSVFIFLLFVFFSFHLFFAMQNIKSGH